MAADSRYEALAGLVRHVAGPTCWLRRVVTAAAVLGGLAGLLLWWAVAGDRVTERWQGTAGSLLVLACALAPAAWLLNVRAALTGLLEVPEKVGGVAARRGAELLDRSRPARPTGGVRGAVGAVRRIARDYSDVVGSWRTVAQLLVPSFWALTALALVAVPVVVVLAVVAALFAQLT